MVHHDKFWLDDLSLLYRDEKYLDFIPRPRMTRTEQLNALSRLAIYSGIVSLMLGQGTNHLYFVVGVITLMIILNMFIGLDPTHNQKEIQRARGHRIQDQADEEAQIAIINGVDPSALKSTLSFPASSILDATPSLTQTQTQRHPHSQTTLIDPESDTPSVSVGHIDSNGDIIFPPEKTGPTLEEDKRLLSADELRTIEKLSCREPTSDNPFMNPTMGEYAEQDFPSACNANDEDIKATINEKFTEQLYRDVGDLWGRYNSERQYYSLPNTKRPNDQREFAEWCYNQYDTCKEDQRHCLRYEDLRYKR